MPSDQMTTDVSQVLSGGQLNRIHLYARKFSSSILTKVAPSGEDFEESFFCHLVKTIKTKGFCIIMALINENFNCCDGLACEKSPLVMVLVLETRNKGTCLVELDYSCN